MPTGEKVRVLVVDDEGPFRELIQRKLERNGFAVQGAASAEEALAAAEKAELDVAILDIALPGLSGVELLRRLKARDPSLEAVMLTGHATLETAIEAMKLGAYDYLEKPLQFGRLKLVVEKAWERRRIARENLQLREELRRQAPSYAIVGASLAMREVMELVDLVAPSASAVLIEGESGSGKELVAREIHRRSPRAERPFIAINCGALQETLLENELFGHVRGAFTGATEDQAGLFEAAHQGTLFIDEVCEMAPSIQKKFLRVLENGEFRRVGEGRVRNVDVRIIAATNRRTLAEVEAGRFREDLYYRLNVLYVPVPPLRERPEDVPLLVEHFLERLRTRRGVRPRVTAEAMARLSAYHWPGNCRELANVVERAAILCRDGAIEAADLPPLRAQEERAAPAAAPLRAPPPDASPDAPQSTLEAVERERIREALARSSGNKTAAARELGISLRSLYRKLERHGI